MIISLIMHKLPLIPGYTFRDPTIEQYNLVHKFDFLNGFRVIRDRSTGIGDRPIDAASTAYLKDITTVHYDPSLTYGRVKEYPYQQFQPHFALFAQKCLCFKGFFRQGVFNSPDEHYRIRHVNIIYYLEDNTLSVIEPAVDNSGFQQGRLVRRGRVPKNTMGDTYHWKDFNVGIDVCIHGVAYHIVDCDLFTREYLTSQGIDVGDKEEAPVDPYTQFRASVERQPTRITPVPDDKRRRFLEYDRMVLTFTASWNGDVYQIMYFLTDDAIAVREIQKPNCGKDPVTMLLKRMKVPKDWKNLPSSYPSCYMEYGDPEILEYYTPKDFKIGGTVFIFGRRFFLHDCDSFTRKYYAEMLGEAQPEGIPIHRDERESVPEYKPPPHIKFGSPEDTYATCLSFMPKPPRKDLIRQLLNFPKRLRYSLRMDVVHPEEEDREFVMEYSLSEGTIIITELQKRNSGRAGGRFLKATLVPKPNSDRDNPDYYTPQDFFIGARINVFNHYFIVNGVDLFVYRYVEANPEKFPDNVRENIRDYFVREGLLQAEITAKAKQLREEEDMAKKFDRSIKRHVVDDTEECIKDVEVEARRQYEGEHGELRPPTPPPEELCPDIFKTKDPEGRTNFENSAGDFKRQERKQISWKEPVEQY